MSELQASVSQLSNQLSTIKVERAFPHNHHFHHPHHQLVERRQGRELSLPHDHHLQHTHHQPVEQKRTFFCKVLCFRYILGPCVSVLHRSSSLSVSWAKPRWSHSSPAWRLILWGKKIVSPQKCSDWEAEGSGSGNSSTAGNRKYEGGQQHWEPGDRHLNQHLHLHTKHQHFHQHHNGWYKDYLDYLGN